MATISSLRALCAIAVFALAFVLLNALANAPRTLLETTSSSLRKVFTFDISPTPDPEAASEDGRVIFAMVMFGAGSAEEGQHMLKSILMQSSRPIEVHIICSNDSAPVIQQRLALVTRPRHDVRAVFYPVTPEAILARAARAGIGSKHHAGVGGLAKMLIHELIPAERALYVDTDAMFATDPVLLWRAFTRLAAASPGMLVALTHAGPLSGGGDVCTCLMGLHLARMRAAPLLPSPFFSPEANAQAIGNVDAWTSANINPLEPPWGDQGLFWAMWKKDATAFGRLSRSWDLTTCKYHYGLTLSGPQNQTEVHPQHLGPDQSEEETEGMFPGIIHFNCQGNEDSVFDSPHLRARPEWGPLVTYVAQYKWVWLNQGDGDARVVIRTAVDIRFEDERLALASNGSTNATARSRNVV
ncbi:hypothetical protein AURDEDRAFT_174070 [Auricularia subglabra TFB-10046 SS5]|nr:hypothetical protein AURDEDRAFT_174070 [Auricularia subglabra TFB-10046 SS5]